MSEKIEIDLNEALEVFLSLEEMVKFFHQPDNFDRDKVDSFMNKQAGYKMLAHLYYDVVWGWLPNDTQKMIEER